MSVFIGLCKCTSEGKPLLYRGSAIFRGRPYRVGHSQGSLMATRPDARLPWTAQFPWPTLGSSWSSASARFDDTKFTFMLLGNLLDFHPHFDDSYHFSLLSTSCIHTFLPSYHIYDHFLALPYYRDQKGLCHCLCWALCSSLSCTSDLLFSSIRTSLDFPNTDLKSLPSQLRPPTFPQLSRLLGQQITISCIPSPGNNSNIHQIA